MDNFNTKGDRNYGKTRKSSRIRKEVIYPKKTKDIQRLRARDNKLALRDLVSDFNIPEKMTRERSNLKYVRYMHYKKIQDYYDDYMEMLLDEIIKENEDRRRDDGDEQAYESHTSSYRKRAYSDDYIWFASNNEPEIKKPHDSSDNRTCPNCGYEF